MPITVERKQEVMKKFGIHEKDTGSSDVQVALMTERISHIQEHLKQFPKDNNSRRGLLKLVAKRRRLLDYLRATAEDRYKALLEQLNIRK